MMTASTLVGSILGCFLFTGLAMVVTPFWPKSVEKIIIVGFIMLFVLVILDHLVRDEPLSATIFRIVIGQVVTVLLLIVGQFASQSRKSQPGEFHRCAF
jgi:uncharacterized PurR-regulated membrane protein YhhQ (DUF165 family)